MQQYNYQDLSKSAHRPPQISFYRGSLKIEKDLELVSRPHFS